MSGYFDALLRSGGMAPAPPIQPAAPESGLEGIGEEPALPVPAAAQAPPMPAAALPEAARPAAELAPPVAAPLPAPLALHPAPAAAIASPRAVTEPSREASLPRPAPEQRTPPPAARPVAAADPGHALIQAALDWVAADPQGVSRAAPSEPAIAPSRDGLPGLAPPLGEPRRSEAMPPAAPAPHDPLQGALHDETVEISIGTIQVRVDAPAVQAAAQTAPAPTASVPRPTRGALARRSLRRF